MAYKTRHRERLARSATAITVSGTARARRGSAIHTTTLPPPRRSKKRLNIRRLRAQFGKMGVLVAAALIAIILIVVIANANTKNVPIKDVAAFRVPTTAVSAVMTVSAKYNMEFADLLTLYALENAFFPSRTTKDVDAETLEKEVIVHYAKLKSGYKANYFKKYYDLIAGVLNELTSFPIGDGEYMYGDSYTAKAPSCIIYDRDNTAGKLPVMSMASGEVTACKTTSEGVTVTVKTNSGMLLTYSGLMNTAPDIKEGGVLSSGAFLGFMGEGKDGRASISVAITPRQNITKDAFRINPYVFLRYIELKKEGVT